MDSHVDIKLLNFLYSKLPHSLKTDNVLLAFVVFSEICTPETVAACQLLLFDCF